MSGKLAFKKIGLVFSALILVLTGARPLTNALAASSDASVQPYIDSIKKSMESEKPQGEGNQPYIDSIKSKMAPDPNEGQSYIEKLQKSDPEKDKPVPAEPYLETEKRKIEGKPERGSAIDAVANGKSQLEMKRPGAIHFAGGLRVGVGNSRKIDGNSSIKQAEFRTIYPDKWVPDVTVFTEYQPFHSEWFGNVGILGSLGYTQFKGTGQFAQILSYSGKSFGANSQTEFRFNMMPIEVGAIYRFNLFRIVRPYASAGLLGVGYLETRNDGKTSHHGFSSGVTGTVGVAILLDWVSNGMTWDVYSERGVKHSYLTVEYTTIKTAKGDVSFNTSGLYSGVAFEF